MARLQSTATAGYFPTPPSVASLIAQALAPAAKKGARLLDPCCGKGSAASDVAKAWNMTSYGIELESLRASDAQKILRRVINVDVQNARLPNGSIQVLYENPPYDYAEGEGKRLEYTFLRETTPWLQPGGVLVFLVPQFRVDARMANYLVSHFDDLTAYRFPDPEYAAFKQCVIFGVKKELAIKDAAATKAFHELCQGELPILQAPFAHPYAIPEPTPARFFFHGAELSGPDLIDEAEQHGVGSTAEWRDLFDPGDLDDLQTFRPLMPFRKGHLASMIAAGVLQNVRLKKNGQEMLIKGHIRKMQVVVEVKKSKDAGVPDKIVTRDQFLTEIISINLTTGASQVISESDALARFIEEWQATLAAQVAETFKPLYDFDLKAQGPRVNDLLNSLSKERKIPGRRETGLFEAQKHTVVALWRRLHQAKYALCVGEPGVGKTTIATSVAQMRRIIDGSPKPTLVLCPPHLTPKWKREIEEIVPGSKAFILRSVSDVQRVIEFAETHPAIPTFAVLSRETAKLGNRWYGATTLRKQYHRKDRRHKVSVTPFRACPRCGAAQSEVDTNGKEIALIQDATFFDKRRRVCMHCGEPLHQQHPITPKSRPRVGLASYIAQYHHHAFGLFVADEAHQLKGQATDQGNALGVLIRACDKTLILTGTIYGGRSTSLFFLLHRLSSKVRRQFRWDDAFKWAERYGVIEREGFAPKGNHDEGFGVFSGKLRMVTSVHETPGVSPALVTRLLDAAVFLSLPDLGFKLPGYSEIAHEFDMPEAMKKAYEGLENKLGAARSEALNHKNASPLGLLQEALLGWPNAAWRSENIFKGPGDLLASAPALKSKSPKEEWLLAECLAQKERGRKVIVFCRQTNTRDITQHLEDRMEKLGLRVVNLHSQVSADKREKWLKDRTPKTDVLIVNARCVDTGLDLVDYQTIIWYELDYSLYIMMQATKRVYRVGQVNDVEIHFATYKETAEQRGFAMMGQKWSAAQLLYGDSVDCALAQNTDASGGFLAQLTKSIIEKTQVASLSEFFKDASKTKPKAGRRAPALELPKGEVMPSVTVSVPAVIRPDGWVQSSLF
jgi:hypothetical protein